MFGLFKRKGNVGQAAVTPAVMSPDSSQLVKIEQHPFKRAFEREIDSWCYGMEKLGEVPLPQVVFKIIRELRAVFEEATKQGYVFDIDFVARRLYESSGKIVPLREVVFALVAVLPNTESLSNDEKRTYALTLARLERSHSGAVDRVKQRVQAIREQQYETQQRL